MHKSRPTMEIDGLEKFGVRQKSLEWSRDLADTMIKRSETRLTFDHRASHGGSHKKFFSPIPREFMEQSPRTGGLVWRSVEEPLFFTPRCSGRTFGHDWRASSGDSGISRRGSSSRDCEGHSFRTHVEGGVRGVVVGDFLRRLVARTLAQQFSKAVLEATTPFQFDLSTQAGIEAVTHALHASSLDEDATVVSIDGVGAFDLSHFPQCHGLRVDGHGAQRQVVAIRPSVLRPTVFTFVGGWLWDHPRHSSGRGRCSSVWVCTRVSLLCQTGWSLQKGSHSWMTSIWCVIQSGWKLCARSSARSFGGTPIDIHSGKTKIWNRSGVTPTGVDRKCTTQTPLFQDIPVSQQGMGALRAFGTAPWCVVSECFSALPPTTRRCTTVCARLWVTVRVPFSSQPSHSTFDVCGLPGEVTGGCPLGELGWFSGDRGATPDHNPRHPKTNQASPGVGSMCVLQGREGIPQWGILAISGRTRALVLSQSGPLAGVPFHCRDTHWFRALPHVALATTSIAIAPPHPRLPMRPSLRCVRGSGPERFRSGSGICWEGGATVSTNVMVRDLDLSQVPAKGCPCLEAPNLREMRHWSALCGVMGLPGLGHTHTRRSTQSCKGEDVSWGGVWRARLVVLVGEVGGRWSSETASFLSSLAQHKGQEVPELKASVEAVVEKVGCDVDVRGCEGLCNHCWGAGRVEFFWSWAFRAWFFLTSGECIPSHFQLKKRNKVNSLRTKHFPRLSERDFCSTKQSSLRDNVKKLKYLRAETSDSRSKLQFVFHAGRLHVMFCSFFFLMHLMSSWRSHFAQALWKNDRFDADYFLCSRVKNCASLHLDSLTSTSLTVVRNGYNKFFWEKLHWND